MYRSEERENSDCASVRIFECTCSVNRPFSGQLNKFLVFTVVKRQVRPLIFQDKTECSTNADFLWFWGQICCGDELLNAGASCLFKVSGRLSRSVQVG